MKKIQRSQQKRITLQTKIIRYMRRSRYISVREAARRIECSPSSINHYEHGRLDLPLDRIRQLTSAYGYSMEEFEKFESGASLPVLSIKDECISLLDRIDDAKMKAVHAVLIGFVS
jgi:transcriptional regulator with XRE-family HTH domain